ncbi:MAG: cache domain-containing protein [Thiotrichaceae bacterium]
MKQKVARLVTANHYDIGNTKGNYYFILDMNGKMIANGEDAGSRQCRFFQLLADKNGKYFAREIIDVVKKHQEGFVEYV